MLPFKTLHQRLISTISSGAKKKNKKFVWDVNKEPGVQCVCSKRTVRPCLQRLQCVLFCAIIAL